MRAHYSRFLLLIVIALTATSLTVPLTVASDRSKPSQTVIVEDFQAGSSPCGFVVQRDVKGAVSIVPSVDDRGNLVSSIDRVRLNGTLSNPANGMAVEIRWVQQNRNITFVANGKSIDVSMQMTGSFNRGYDIASSELSMDLPLDGAEMVTYTAGERSDDPWTHVCSLLA